MLLNRSTNSKYDIFTQVSGYTYNPDNKTFQQITDSDGNDEEPIWAPNGYQILFCSDRSANGEKTGRHSLYLMNFDGSNQKIVFSDPNINARTPSFRQDGKYIGFSVQGLQGWSLFVMNYKYPTIRYRISDWGFCRMSWNPRNQNEIVYVKAREGGNNLGDYSDIVISTLILENNKFELKEIINLSKVYLKEPYMAWISDTCPTWSIDGEKIIFSSADKRDVRDLYRNIQSELYRYNWILYTIKRDGTERKKIGDGIFSQGLYPSW